MLHPIQENGQKSALKSDCQNPISLFKSSHDSTFTLCFRTLCYLNLFTVLRVCNPHASKTKKETLHQCLNEVDVETLIAAEVSRVCSVIFLKSDNKDERSRGGTRRDLSQTTHSRSCTYLNTPPCPLSGSPDRTQELQVRLGPRCRL